MDCDEARGWAAEEEQLAQTRHIMGCQGPAFETNLNYRSVSRIQYTCPLLFLNTSFLVQHPSPLSQSSMDAASTSDKSMAVLSLVSTFNLNILTVRRVYEFRRAARSVSHEVRRLG